MEDISLLNNKLLIENIRRLCSQHNIKITNLEKELGFGAGIISRWGNDADPSLSKIIQVADYFHVSIDEVVGYKQNLNDEFLNKLYQQTEKKIIFWKLVTNDTTTEYPNIKLFDVGADEYKLYDKEEYSQTHYVTKYNGGYIIMYSFYKYGSLLSPTDVRLFIQPTQESYLVEQNYTESTLKMLWIKILNSLGDDAPDEVKAEDLKNSFINNKPTKTLDSYSDEQLKQIIKNMINIEPQLPKLFNAINDPEFMKLFNMIQYPNLQQNLELAQKLSPYYAMIVDELGDIAQKTP
jgi:transcriptional regulator with XRE-family HTH domain